MLFLGVFGGENGFERRKNEFEARRFWFHAFWQWREEQQIRLLSGQSESIQITTKLAFHYKLEIEPN